MDDYACPWFINAAATTLPSVALSCTNSRGINNRSQYTYMYIMPSIPRCYVAMASWFEIIRVNRPLFINSSFGFMAIFEWWQTTTSLVWCCARPIKIRTRIFKESQNDENTEDTFDKLLYWISVILYAMRNNQRLQCDYNYWYIFQNIIIGIFFKKKITIHWCLSSASSDMTREEDSDIGLIDARVHLLTRTHRHDSKAVVSDQ